MPAAVRFLSSKTLRNVFFDAQWRFSHDKLREALLAALAPDERRRLHRLVGEVVAKVHGTSGVHEVALAFHFEQAGDRAKAARLTAQAGTSALRRGALHEAATLLARAERLEEQAGAPLLERTATMRRLLRASFGVDRRAECLEICLKGMTLLGRPIPQTRAGWMVTLLQETGIELRNRIVGANRCRGAAAPSTLSPAALRAQVPGCRAASAAHRRPHPVVAWPCAAGRDRFCHESEQRHPP